MNVASDWIKRKVARFRPGQPSTDGAADATASGRSSSATAKAPRSTQERLHATLRRADEALTPRQLRQLLADLQAVCAPQISDIEGGQQAEKIIAWSHSASAEQRKDLWLLLCEQFAPDAHSIRAAHEQHAAAVGADEQAQAEINLRLALVSPRTRLLQRMAVPAQGMRFLLDMRTALHPQLKGDKCLRALDAELEHLFGTWFDMAFLQPQRLSWDSPASLLEKLIQYEAVHDIRSWADLKNRLDSDRRCYGFFHPSLPGEPLIFVEIALLDHMADAIAPLLDEKAAPANLQKATTAIFYSISNTQQGLRGVSFGNSLIKHVVETLKKEFPQLRHFATLSPIPGFRAWLGKNASTVLQALPDKARAELVRALGSDGVNNGNTSHSGNNSNNLDSAALAPLVLGAVEEPLALAEKSPLREFLLTACAQYLGVAAPGGKPLDAVARFHLGNGACVQRLNWAGDRSAKGLKQSYGLMVNYLYDLKRLDKHRQQLAQGSIPVSKEIQARLR